MAASLAWNTYPILVRKCNGCDRAMCLCNVDHFDMVDSSSIIHAPDV